MQMGVSEPRPKKSYLTGANAVPLGPVVAEAALAGAPPAGSQAGVAVAASVAVPLPPVSAVQEPPGTHRANFHRRSESILRSGSPTSMHMQNLDMLASPVLEPKRAFVECSICVYTGHGHARTCCQ